MLNAASISFRPLLWLIIPTFRNTTVLASPQPSSSLRAARASALAGGWKTSGSMPCGTTHVCSRLMPLRTKPSADQADGVMNTTDGSMSLHSIARFRARSEEVPNSDVPKTIVRAAPQGKGSRSNGK